MFPQVRPGPVLSCSRAGWSNPLQQRRTGPPGRVVLRARGRVAAGPNRSMLTPPHAYDTVAHCGPTTCNYGNCLHAVLPTYVVSAHLW